MRIPGLGSRVRARPWSFDDRVVHLTLADQTVVPRPDEVAQWVDVLAAGNPDVRAVRTGALFPDAAARFAEAGFDVIDTLALLRVRLVRAGIRDGAAARHGAPGGPRGTGRHPCSTAPPSATRGATTPATSTTSATPPRPTTPPPATSARRLAAGWSPSPSRVLPAARATCNGSPSIRSTNAPGTVGPWSSTPSRWMRRRRLEHGVVNTAVSNEPALRLYESLGFRRLPEQLVVMQFDLAAAR